MLAMMVGAEFGQFQRGLLHQSSVAQRQPTRDAHTAVPAAASLEAANPTPEDSAAARVLQTIGSIERIRAIDEAAAFLDEPAGLRVERPDEVIAPAMGRSDEHKLVAEREEIRAFDVCRVGIREEDTLEFPFRKLVVRSLVQGDTSLAAFGLVEVAAVHHVRSVLVAEHEWVAEVVILHSGRVLGEDRVGRKFFPFDQLVIFRRGDPTLRLPVADARVKGQGPATRVERGATGEAMFFAQRLRWPER